MYKPHITWVVGTDSN